MKYGKIAFVAAFLALAVANPVLAQQGRRGAGRMGQGQGMGMGQMGMMPQMNAFQPTALLERAEELSLTEEQRTALAGLRDVAEEARKEAKKGHDSYATRLHEAMAAAEPDVEQMRGLFQGAHGFMGQMRWADMEAAMAAKALLSEEQRKLVAPDTRRGRMHMRNR